MTMNKKCCDQNRRKKPYTSAEVRHMWDAYNRGVYDIAYILLMVETGMRWREVMALKPEYVDWERRIITYRCPKVGTVETSPFGKELDAPLQYVIASLPITGDKPETEFQRRCCAALEASGIPDVNVLLGRHTYLTNQMR